MKVQYYYDAQFRRVLKHLIRLFGEFQVQYTIDANGNPVYRKVPCRYADISRLAAAIIMGNSENTLPTAPSMTISVQSLKMDRNSIRSPVTETIVLGTNKSPAQNQYEDELDEQYKIDRMQPVPWILTFDLNIWTTNLKNKLELFEQITTLFAPSVTLKLSENPVDWGSEVDVELVDCQFSSRSVPQGTDTDLDIMTLSFTCPIWFQLPAKVTKPKLIQQIVTNIGMSTDEMDIELGNINDMVIDIFTPKNMCILVEQLYDQNNQIINDEYELTLVSSSLNQQSSTGNIFSWDIYLKYLDPQYDSKQIQIRFQEGIEEENPIKGIVTNIGSGSRANKIQVKIEDTNYQVYHYAIKSFITEKSQLNNVLPEDYFISTAEMNIIYKNTVIPPNFMFKITNDGAELIYPETIQLYVYNIDDSAYYKYNEKIGWHKSVTNVYRQGYWRIGFKDI